MISVEAWTTIYYLNIRGASTRSIAEEVRVARNTVRRAIRSDKPPSYKRAPCLKAGGLLFIREPIKKSHGMPVEEMRAILSNAGLKGIKHKETKSEYKGKYQKSD